jgi:hypothetical protein
MATVSLAAPSATTPIPAEESATVVDSPVADKTSTVASRNPTFIERSSESIVPKVITYAILSTGVLAGGAALIIACAATALKILGASLVIGGLNAYAYGMRTLSDSMNLSIKEQQNRIAMQEK